MYSTMPLINCPDCNAEMKHQVLSLEGAICWVRYTCNRVEELTDDGWHTHTVCMGSPVILIVEDNPTIRLFYERVISGKDFKIVGSAEEALKAFSSHVIHCMITDIRLPGVSGIELTDMLRKAGVKIPILGITALAIPEVILECLAVGMTQVYEKPMTISELRDLLNQWGNI